MATIEKKIHVVTELKPVTTEVPYYKLELSEVEARTLIAILSSIGGCPTDSYRKYTDDIYDALCTGLGETWSSEEVDKINKKISLGKRSMHFDDGF